MTSPRFHALLPFAALGVFLLAHFFHAASWAITLGCLVIIPAVRNGFIAWNAHFPAQTATGLQNKLKIGVHAHAYFVNFFSHRGHREEGGVRN